MVLVLGFRRQNCDLDAIRVGNRGVFLIHGYGAVDASVVCILGDWRTSAFITLFCSELFVFVNFRQEVMYFSFSRRVFRAAPFGSTAIAMPEDSIRGAFSRTRDLALFDFAFSFSEFEIKATKLNFGANIFPIRAQSCLELQCCSCPFGFGRSG